jgi:hypothetical protein
MNISSSDIVHFKDGVLDIRYGAGHKLNGDVDELDLFLVKHGLYPEEIVLTPDQYTGLRDSMRKINLGTINGGTRKDFSKDTRTFCRITIRHFGH